MAFTQVQKRVLTDAFSSLELSAKRMIRLLELDMPEADVAAHLQNMIDLLESVKSSIDLGTGAAVLLDRINKMKDAPARAEDAPTSSK